MAGSNGNGNGIKLEGTLDCSSVPGIRKKLLKAARNEATRNMEIDFSQVTFTDTAGVALLVEVMRHLNRRSGKLLLEGANEQVRQMICMARLDSIFTMKASTDGEI